MKRYLRKRIKKGSIKRQSEKVCVREKVRKRESGRQRDKKSQREKERKRERGARESESENETVHRIHGDLNSREKQMGFYEAFVR